MIELVLAHIHAVVGRARGLVALTFDFGELWLDFSAAKKGDRGQEFSIMKGMFWALITSELGAISPFLLEDLKRMGALLILGEIMKLKLLVSQH